MSRPNFDRLDTRRGLGDYDCEVEDLIDYALELEQQVKELKDELNDVYCFTCCPHCSPAGEQLEAKDE